MTRFDQAIRSLDRGELKEGQTILEALLREDPHNPAVLYNLGMCYSEQGKLQASIEVLKQCIEIAPDYINAYAALGFSYARAGQTDKALQILQEAQHKHPNNVFVLKNLITPRSSTTLACATASKANSHRPSKSLRDALT